MASATIPYIGSKISLISNSEIRYEGILYTINTQESTIALQAVRCFGTEGRATDRKMTEIPASSEVYDFIIFRGQDIKDLTVLDGSAAQSAQMNDPAILSVNQKPAGSSSSTGNGGGKGSSAAAPAKAPASKGSSGSHRGGNGGGGQSWGSASGWDGSGGGYGSSAFANGGWSSNSAWSNNTRTGQSGGSAWGGGRQQQGYDGGGGKGGYGAHAKGGKSSGGSGGYGKGGGKGSDGSRGQGKGAKGSSGGQSSKGNNKGGGYKGGAGDSGAPVGELLPEVNAEAKKEYAEAFDYEGTTAKFDKLSNLEGETNLDEKLKPLAGYNKTKSFFDSISCEATERAGEVERQRVNRDEARQADRETFGDTRRPPRPTGGRRGKGMRRGGAPRGYKS